MRTTKAIIICIVTATAMVADAAVVKSERGFTLTAPRVEVTFEDGMIAAVKNLVTGEMHASWGAGHSRILCGLGTIAGRCRCGDEAS